MTQILLITALLLSAVTGYAQIKLPRYVYQMEDLDKAIAEAKEKKKLLMIVEGNLNGSGTTMADVLLSTFHTFKKETVPVLYNSRNQEFRPPREALRLLRGPNRGRFIPRAAILNADGSKGYVLFPYSMLIDEMNECEDQVKDLLKGHPEAYKPLLSDRAPGSRIRKNSGPTVTLPLPAQDWTNREGKTIRAGVTAIGDGKVTFLMPDGKTVSYPLEKLSDESQRKLKAVQLRSNE